MKINDSEILKWTVSPKISHWKLNVDFDLSINLGFDEKNEFIAVVGKTGSGKSTMLKHMNGLWYRSLS